MISGVPATSPGPAATSLSVYGSEAELDGGPKTRGLSLRNLGFQLMVALIGIALAFL